jgi:DNA-binding MarR family transcriptional regulator
MQPPKQKKAAAFPITGARARTPAPTSTSPNYEAMAELRYQIRRFLRFSEDASQKMGLEPHQYQLMLAVKGLPAGVRPRISALAERLQIKHHSTVELVNRLAARGYLQRQRGDEDKREVLLALTPKGEEVLRHLALHHREELRLLGPAFIAAMKAVVKSRNAAGSQRRSSAPHGAKTKA